MKFQQWEVFEKHLKEALSHRLSPLYALSVKDPEERSHLLSQIHKELRQVEGVDLVVTTSVQSALAHLQTVSLFAARRVAFFDGDCAPFADYTPGGTGHLILAAAENKTLQKLYTKHKREMVWLDLTAEKPWEKKQRLERFVERALQKSGKRFSRQIVEALVERSAGHSHLLTQEIEKLLCYACDQEEISLKDVKAVGIPLFQEEGFAFAEEILWNHKSAPSVPDLATLLPLIGQLRYLLEQALVISSLKEAGKSSQEIGDELPKLSPRVIDKALRRVERKRSEDFVAALKALFALELGAKNSEATPQILFDRFRAQIR